MKVRRLIHGNNENMDILRKDQQATANVHYVSEKTPHSYFNYNFVISESISMSFGKHVVGEVSNNSA